MQKEPWDLNTPPEIGPRKAAAQRRIRERFDRFGPDVISTITRFATEEGGIEWLLGLFNLDPSPNLDAQLDALSYYIAQSGEARFLMRAHYAKWNKSHPAKVEEPKETFSPVLVNNSNESISASTAGEAEAKQSVAKASEAPDPAGPEIQVPGYRGPERRKQRNDRRGGINAIQKNRRYGGDRRKKK